MTIVTVLALSFDNSKTAVKTCSILESKHPTILLKINAGP